MCSVNILPPSSKALRVLRGSVWGRQTCGEHAPILNDSQNHSKPTGWSLQLETSFTKNPSYLLPFLTPPLCARRSVLQRYKELLCKRGKGRKWEASAGHATEARRPAAKGLLPDSSDSWEPSESLDPWSQKKPSS